MTSHRAAPRDQIVVEPPTVDDGATIWRLAGESRALDVNSSYAYLLWCRDFAATSLVARADGLMAGFVTGYVRPQAADTLFVWQVAVAADQRGRRLARRMIDRLVDRVDRTDRPIRWLETTITPDNAASVALFTGFARDRGAEVTTEVLFAPQQFPDGHDGEVLYRIGPLGPRGGPGTA